MTGETAFISPLLTRQLDINKQRSNIAQRSSGKSLSRASS